MFELYFRINDNEPELQGTFDTEVEAEKYPQFRWVALEDL